METNALLVLDTWPSATEFKTDLINTMKSNGLNIITDLEATDILLAVNYMTSLIYSYYKNYYLSNASKERTLELMSITASGKLNFYASQLKAYKDAYAHDFKSLGGNENSSSHDTTLNRSGKSKQATTPETIAKGTDYIDDYSSSEQKYENSNKETGTRSYNSTIKGSEQDYWKNIISIPKRLFEDIIGSFSKFFFSSTLELTPCAVLTIEQAIQKLKEEIKALDTTTTTEINSLKRLITINQEEIKDLKTSVDTLVTAGENTDNRVTTLERQTGDIQRRIDRTDTNLENLTKVTPTDIGVKDNKLGLKHDTTWLTNQDAITLGDNLTYNETTKTLNAKGGEFQELYYVKNGDILTEELYNKIINKKINIYILRLTGGSVTHQYMYCRIFTSSTTSITFYLSTLPTISVDEVSFYYDEITWTINQPIKISQGYAWNYKISFFKSSNRTYTTIRTNKGDSYSLNILNDTATPKVLKCVNNTLSWVELPKYYEHDGMLKVNTNYIMFKYISTDGVAQTDFNQLINDFSGNYITASGSFELGTDQIAMVYGIDFDTLTLSCNVLDMSTHKLRNDEIAFSDLTIGTYSENVRLIQ